MILLFLIYSWYNQWGRLRRPVDLHRKELTRACSFVSCMLHAFLETSLEHERCFIGAVPSLPSTPELHWQREISIQRKWIVLVLHPLWNTHTTHPHTPLNSRGNLWEGRTDQRSERLHSGICFHLCLQKMQWSFSLPMHLDNFECVRDL